MKRHLPWLAVAALVCPCGSLFAQPAAPKSLLIYYGYPSLINGSKDLVQASSEFKRYDIAIIAGGLEEAKHDDHAKTKQIIATTKTTQFFGYIPLGNRPGRDKCMSQREIIIRVQNWANMGAAGILLDEFGFDHGNNRKRQNDIVAAVHHAKLMAIANAWMPDDVFGVSDGEQPALLPSDGYLWESYRFVEGKPAGLKEWRQKADAIAKHRQKLPLHIFSVSTNLVQPKNADTLFAHQWFCAAIDGHAATSWGYPNYGATDSRAPLMASPMNRHTPAYFGDNLAQNHVVVNGSEVSRATTRGEITVDADKLTGRFDGKK